MKPLMLTEIRGVNGIGLPGLRLRDPRGLRIWALGCTRPTWRPGRLSKSALSRVIMGVTPFRLPATLLTTYLLSPVGVSVGLRRIRNPKR